jgi:RNA polymerase sigma-70 factor (ECF subfamily)
MPESQSGNLITSNEGWRRLIAEAKNGNQTSLDEVCKNLLPLVEQVSQSVYPTYLQAKAGKSDLVQEAMLGVSEHIASLQGSHINDLHAWVHVIVENKAMDLKRRYLAGKRDILREQSISQRNPYAENSRNLEMGLEDSSQTPVGKLISAEQAQHIQHLVLELCPHYREIVQLRHREGLSFPEIASRTGRTEAAVKNIYVRAVASLKHELTKG